MSRDFQAWPSGCAYESEPGAVATGFLYNAKIMGSGAKILGHSNIKMTERYAQLARQYIGRTSDTALEIWKSFERATQKAKIRQTDVRVLCAREIFKRFFCVAKLLKGLVARDGIEPPTPALFRAAYRIAEVV